MALSISQAATAPWYAERSDTIVWQKTAHSLLSLSLALKIVKAGLQASMSRCMEEIEVR